MLTPEQIGIIALAIVVIAMLVERLFSKSAPSTVAAVVPKVEPVAAKPVTPDAHAHEAVSATLTAASNALVAAHSVAGSTNPTVISAAANLAQAAGSASLAAHRSSQHISPQG